PGAKSSDGLPGTVTRPDFTGCLNCRWLHLVLAKYQPSSSSRLIISFTFILVPFLLTVYHLYLHPSTRL
ncbi:hypothetical protein L2E80_25250, partial [Planktothrix agardhii 1812]